MSLVEKNFTVETKITPLKIKRDRLLVLDQLALPTQSEWIECLDEKDVARVIKEMNVRGAPAIGIAAAYGFYLAIWSLSQTQKKISETSLQRIKKTLDASRPTAVNLFWATSQMYEHALNWLKQNPTAVKRKDYTGLLLQLYEQAIAIHDDDRNRCLRMNQIAADYILKNFPKEKYRVLTHCNTGALATGGIGTALGLVRVLHALGKIEMVYADETRPYLQGARLTAYELWKEKIPATLTVDSQAGYLMKKGLIDFVVVGADRITRRGDVANKIGTYALSVLAKEHNIPFFVAAPLSTFDSSIEKGEEIPIEERAAKEVLFVGEKQIAPKINVINYSFDVTQSENINAIFNEREVVQ